MTATRPEVSQSLSWAPASGHLHDIKHTSGGRPAGGIPTWLTTPLTFLPGVRVEFKQPQSQHRKIFSDKVLQKPKSI